MAERSFPFDGGTGGIVTEADWSAMASAWQRDGVIASDWSDTSLTVYSEGEAGKLKVRPGRATLKGFHYSLDADHAINYSLNADPSKYRWDLVVLRLDTGTNQITLAVAEGVPDGSAPAPSANEIPLASILVPPLSAPVPAGSSNVVEERRLYGQIVERIYDASGTYQPNSAAPLGSLQNRVTSVGTSRMYLKSKANQWGQLLTQPDADARYAPIGGGGGGGVTICTSTTRPASPTQGQQILETDTQATHIWSGSAWIRTSPYTERIRLWTTDHDIVIGTAGTTVNHPYKSLLHRNAINANGSAGAYTGFTVPTSGFYQISYSGLAYNTAVKLMPVAYLNVAGAIEACSAEVGDDTMYQTGHYGMSMSVVLNLLSNQTVTTTITSMNGTGTLKMYYTSLQAHRIG
ncbi:hypothetical protein ACFWY5_29845 [Nonomuraea sp. NPDC059007]|uniref:hypothetical protein n=1 Tax=Nonomuraea sp. NPDC059007 TaxID=3346692 RepID=UPI0036B7E9BD